LSRQLLFGDLKQGGTLKIDVVDNKITIDVIKDNVVEDA